MPSAILLAHIDIWVAELEREVQAFEDAVDEVELVMDEIENAAKFGEEDDHDLQQQRLSELDAALQAAGRIADLVNAANATLRDAIDASQQFIRNEKHLQPPQTQPAAPPVQFAQPAQLNQNSHNGAHPVPVVTPHRVVKARLVTSGLPAAHSDLPPLLHSPGQEPLSPGTLILQGRYRIVRLLHARPRINLYLGYRLPARQFQQGQPAEATAPELVAIRELVLVGLRAEEQEVVTQAAFEEFVSPGMFGSPRLPGVGDRVSIEHERHYLVMQLRPTKGIRRAVAVPLADSLLAHHKWPAWLDMPLALEWGEQLARIIARLHRMGCIIGNLDPVTILVDDGGAASWAPVLLVSWPPASQFWPPGSARDHIARIFPIAGTSTESAFTAPEVSAGRYDERSDIYALGAILYLLFTRYAPASSALRNLAESEQRLDHSDLLSAPEGISLVPPHLLNTRISPRLEAILTRALALDPAQRYPSAFALVEALESIDPAIDFADRFATQPQMRVYHDSKITKVLEWVKRELNE